jgi:hypothetical protein
MALKVADDISKSCVTVAMRADEYIGVDRIKNILPKGFYLAIIKR